MLNAHDALRASYDTEPASDFAGMPLDSAAWLRWHEAVSKPAYAEWQRAMDELDTALGQAVGRHPRTFLPLCEEIITL